MIASRSGVQARRFWDEGVMPSDAAALAAEKAIAATGIDRRPHRRAHQHLGVPRLHRALDRVARAPRARARARLPQLRCRQRLPRLPQRHGDDRQHDRARADRLRPGRRRRGQPLRGRAHHRASRTRPRTTRAFGEDFATLTLGSGSAAMVLARSDLAPRGPSASSAGSASPAPRNATCAAATSIAW